MQTMLTQLTLGMNEVLRLNKIISLESLIQPENLPNFPLGTITDFISFEAMLQEDELVRQYMVSYFLNSFILVYLL